MIRAFSLSILLGALLTGGMQPAAAQVSPAAEWKISGLSDKETEAFMRRAENRKALLQWYLKTVAEDTLPACKQYREQLEKSLKDRKKQIADLEKEVAAKSGSEAESALFRLKNARRELENTQTEAARPVGMEGCAEVWESILNDAEWMEQIAFSGELQALARVVQIISAAAEKDAAALRKGVERDTVTATALEYARSGWSTTDALTRIGYYLKYWRQGRLNTTFDTLPLHRRRVVCGWKNNHSSGTLKAFEWALNNVHLPDWQYPSSCWRCGYILNNVFGDSIHGPWYAAPFAGIYSDNHMAFTRNVGGVCGGLSHFGAASACANGVPALTAGEPGHCAYIVLVDGKWTPAYSLSWERGLHWIPWANNWTYSALHLTDDLYAAAAAARLSDGRRILARYYSGRGETDKALRCFESAVRAAPLNYPVWREYAAFLREKQPQNKAAWKKLNRLLCEGVAPAYPEQAAELLRQFVYDPMESVGLSPAELTDVCVLFWQKLSGMGPDRWRIEDFANRQLSLCRKLSRDSEDAVCSLYPAMLSAVAASDDYSGPLMAWGNGVAEKLSESGRKKLTEATLRIFTGDSKLDSARQARLLGSLMLRAEKARDEATFHSVSRLIDPKEVHGTAAVPPFTPFPGKLVSEGGMPFASSTSRWDSPHTHAGLLTRSGGRIHTEKDTNAWIAVKLPRHAYITGVVFAGTNEWKLIHRFRPLQVQVSDTGRDDDWHDVGSPVPATDNYINRFDLRKERPKALYIRVLRPGGPEFFHANGIYVYGEQAA